MAVDCVGLFIIFAQIVDFCGFCVECSGGQRFEFGVGM